MTLELQKFCVTPHGLMYAVDKTIIVILEELKALDAQESHKDLDVDTLTSFSFYRQLIGVRLDYCKNRTQSVLDSMRNLNVDRNDQNYLVCQLVVNKIEELSKLNQEKFIELGTRLNKTIVHH